LSFVNAITFFAGGTRRCDRSRVHGYSGEERSLRSSRTVENAHVMSYFFGKAALRRKSFR